MTISRPVAIAASAAVWLVGIPAMHGALPWFVSSLATRHGWEVGKPGAANLPGLVPIAFGALLLAWIFLTGVRQLPPRATFSELRSGLMTTGPYTFTRNPVYLAELALWIGWCVLLGSLPLLLIIAIGIVAVVRFIVPREERALEARIGEHYLAYKQAVPRWVPRRSRGTMRF